MDLNTLPKNASSLKFSKHDQHVMSLCLTYKVNLGLSLRKTAQALKDIHGISISHQQVANYCKTASACIKPFVDNYDYKTGNVFTADETYINVCEVGCRLFFDHYLLRITRTLFYVIKSSIFCIYTIYII